MADEDDISALRAELADAHRQLAEAQSHSATTLTGDQFLSLIIGLPIVLSFVVLGVVIVWKTTSNPVEVAPHLDKILVAFAIFATPVSSILSAVLGKMQNNKKE